MKTRICLAAVMTLVLLSVRLKEGGSGHHGYSGRRAEGAGSRFLE
jgi:hypothetical protein